MQAARAVALADAAGAKICLCGATSAETVALAHGHHQVMGFAQSLLLSSAVYARRRGRWFRAQPPLRSKDTLKQLQKRFFSNPRAMLAFASALPPGEPIKAWRFPAASGPLATLPSAPLAALGKLVPKKAAAPKHIARAIRLLSVTPFAFTGHAQERGHLAIGSVADLCVLSPTARVKLGPMRPKTSDDFNPFMGLPGLAAPVLVFNRGHLVAQDGKAVGDKPGGTVAVPFALR